MEGGEIVLPAGLIVSLATFFRILLPYILQSEAERRADSDDDQIQ
jgi:hypothetical protein